MVRVKACTCCPNDAGTLLLPFLTSEPVSAQRAGLEGIGQRLAVFSTPGAGPATLDRHSLFGRITPEVEVSLAACSQRRQREGLARVTAGVAADSALPASLAKQLGSYKKQQAHQQVHAQLALSQYVRQLQQGCVVLHGAVSGHAVGAPAYAAVQEPGLRVSTSCRLLASTAYWHQAVEPHALRCSVAGLGPGAQHRGVVLYLPLDAAQKVMGLPQLVAACPLLYHQACKTALLLGDRQVDIVKWTQEDVSSGAVGPGSADRMGYVSILRCSVDVPGYCAGGWASRGRAGTPGAVRRMRACSCTAAVLRLSVSACVQRWSTPITRGHRTTCCRTSWR